LRAKSRVLPLGLDLDGLDANRPTAPSDPGAPPLLLWNHRWEYDKNPVDFFRALYKLQSEGLAFRVALLGERFVRVPSEFAEAKKRLEGRIVHFGYAKDKATYARWLWQADVVVSTAIHDFFGAAVVEALYCHCFPVLPHRLTYPDFVPAAHHPRCLYRSFDELVARLRAAILQIERTRQISFREHVARYDWSQMSNVYDEVMASVSFSPPAALRR
jgi:glycosyltransferase involved in cell wall biosynthesis